MSYLLVEPKQRADDCDVSQAYSLADQEGAGVQVLVQVSKDTLHFLFCLLCSLQERQPKTM